MSWSPRCLVCLLGAGLLTVGCSGSDEPEMASRPFISVFERTSDALADEDGADRSGEGGDPIVERVTFEPVEPESRERLRAIASVSGGWTSLQYEWMLNGEAFGQNAAQVLLPTLATGDVIGLRVIPFRNLRPGKAFQVQSLVRNQKPRIRSLSIERVEADEASVGDGERWRAAVLAEDPDGDNLEIEYRWLINGSESEIEDEFHPVGDLKRGDRIAVRVRVFDGSVWSAPVRTGEIEIGNRLPIIVSVPPRPDATGYFRYKVAVKDTGPDTNLHFALRISPRGMRIDELSGEVTWRPDSDQAGRHEVEVVVRNEEGGEATQVFSLALVSVIEPSPGPAAAR